MSHRASELRGSCEHGNELSGSIKGGVFSVIEQLLASQEGLRYMELVKGLKFLSLCFGYLMMYGEAYELWSSDV
jgi:hypothetical protein